MRQAILLVFSLTLLVLGFSACKKQTRQPNIVLFLADDMGYGDPQCYMPNSKIPTPNIDKLASHGIRFTDAHSPSSVCTPTRYSILTGRYAWRTNLKKGVLGPYNQPLIEPGRLTLPAMLKEQGYSTACIGKWHLGMQWGTKNNNELPTHWDRNFDQSVIDHNQLITRGPLTAGFDYYFGVDVPNFPPYVFIENDKMKGEPTIPKPKNMFGVPGLMLSGWKLEEILPTLTDKAVKYIDNIAKMKPEDPFFLYFASTAPHTPIVPAKKFHGKSKAGPYGDLVHQTDYSLGEIIKALERNGFKENTIIIFTSDNGSPARAGDLFVHGDDFHQTSSVIKKYNHNPNSPWRGMKADILEGGHRVPFIISWPKRIQKNVQIKESICAIDIMASIASILNYKLPENAAEDSFDISGLILGEEVGIDSGGKPLREAIIHHSVDGSFAIRKGKWKMTPQPGTGGWASAPHGKDIVNTPGQLYNLNADPTESSNLWESHPEVVKELKALLKKYKSEGQSIK